MNKNAQALGRLGRGKSKRYSDVERKRRSELMRQLNAQRMASKYDKRMSNTVPVSQNNATKTVKQ